MDTSFVGILRFDFYLNQNLEDVKAAFEEIYREKVDDGTDPEFFGLAPETQFESRGTASVDRYIGLDASEFGTDRFAAFEEIQTFLLHQDSRRFLDAVTIARVTSDGVEAVDDEALIQLQEVLSKIGERTGSIVFDDVFAESYPLAVHPTVLYMDCDSKGDILNDESGIDESACQEYIETIDSALLSDQGCVSVLSSGEIIGTQQVGEIWGPLTAVNAGKPLSDYQLSETTAVPLPDMGALINRLTPFFRSFDWVHFRLQDVDIIEAELIDTSSNVMKLEQDDEREYLKTLLGEEEEVGRIQNYLDYSEMAKELEDINHLISEFDYDGEENHTPYPRYEHQLSEPTDMTLRSTTYFSDSLFETYQRELSHLLNKFDNDLEALDEQQLRITDIITDKITISGTEASIQLNERVRNLTLILVGLTVLLLIGPEPVLNIVGMKPFSSVVEFIVQVIQWLIWLLL